MNKKLREIAKQANAHMKEREYKKDEEGRVIIQMNVKDDKDFLSEFSESETPVISPEVAEFLENSTHAIPAGEPLALHIHSDCIDDEEKVIYESAIKEYYLQKYIANEKEVKRNHILAVSFALFGVLVLISEFIFDYKIGNVVWSEVIDIVAWVLLWEATDIALLETRGLRIKKKRYLAYLSMKIEYISEK